MAKDKKYQDRKPSGWEALQFLRPAHPMKAPQVTCPRAIASDAMHAFTKRLTAKGSGAEAALQPTKKEGPHWREKNGFPCENITKSRKIADLGSRGSWGSFLLQI